MKKEYVVYIRVVALILSCLVATMTFLNILTVATHGIDIEIPDEGEFGWAIDPMEKRILILSSFTVKNHGSFDIDNIDIGATLKTADDIILINYDQEDMSVSHGSIKKFDIVISIYLDSIPFEELFNLLFEDSVFRLTIDIDADYMFGLIHVTVDEVLEYPWQAPLTEYLDDFPVISGIHSLISFAESGFIDFHDTVQLDLIDYLMGIEDFEYLNPEGYVVSLLNDVISEEMNVLTFSTRIPVKELDCALTIGFSLSMGINEEGGWVELQEVSFDYETD